VFNMGMTMYNPGAEVWHAPTTCRWIQCVVVFVGQTIAVLSLTNQGAGYLVDYSHEATVPQGPHPSFGPDLCQLQIQSCSRLQGPLHLASPEGEPAVCGRLSAAQNHRFSLAAMLQQCAGRP